MPPTLTVYVKDAITKEPVAGAKVSVSIGEQKVGAGHTDRRGGRFAKSINPQYLGQALNCRVKKNGYEPQEVTRDVREEETRIEVVFVPETVEFNLTVMDEEGFPLEGVGVIVDAGGNVVGSSYSAGDGLARFRFIPGLESKRLHYNAELEGFERTEGEIELTKEITGTISLRRIEVLPEVKGNVKRVVIHFIFWGTLTFILGLVVTGIAYSMKMGNTVREGAMFFVWFVGAIFSVVLTRKVWRGQSNKLTAVADQLIEFVDDKTKKYLKRGAKS